MFVFVHGAAYSEGREGVRYKVSGKKFLDHLRLCYALQSKTFFGRTSAVFVGINHDDCLNGINKK
jgi:hypothetical protein